MFEPASRSVVATQAEEPKFTTPRKLLGYAPCSMVSIAYSDVTGRIHRAVLLEVGGEFFFAPNGETWAQQLAPASGWLMEQLQAKQRLLATRDVPAVDAVDIVGEDVDVVEQVASVVAKT